MATKDILYWRRCLAIVKYPVLNASLNSCIRRVGDMKGVDPTPNKWKRKMSMDAQSSPPPPRVSPASRTLQTVSPTGLDCTGPADVLPAVAASEGVAFDCAAHVNIHIHIHAVVYALQRCVAVLAGRQLCMCLRCEAGWLRRRSR